MLSPRFTASSLLLLGLLLLFHSTLNLKMHRLRVGSDSSAFESKLNKWVSIKVHEAKLTEADRAEIFDSLYSLNIGGEPDSESFRQMTQRAADFGGYLRWPGIAAIFIGVAGLIRHRKLRRRES